MNVGGLSGGVAELTWGAHVVADDKPATPPPAGPTTSRAARTAQLAELYGPGLTTRQIGARVGSSASWVARQLKAAGIPRRSRGRRPSVPLDQIGELRGRGLSWAEVASELQLSPSAARARLARRQGLPTREEWLASLDQRWFAQCAKVVAHHHEHGCWPGVADSDEATASLGRWLGLQQQRLRLGRLDHNRRTALVEAAPDLASAAGLNHPGASSTSLEV